MIKYTNKYDLPLSIAVWLANDDYDHNPDPNTISATALLKPIRSILLSQIAPVAETSTDVYDKIASSNGTSIHTSIESAWSNADKLPEIIKSLGYPDKVANNVIINPSDTDDTKGKIVVHMEQRYTKKLDNFTITGKLDFCMAGALEDFKTTSTYSYIKGSNNADYQKQGSIYRWLRPDIVTKDYLSIRYIFTDWSSASARQNKDYPNQRILTKVLPLLSVEETEAFIRQKISSIIKYADKPQEDFPECTPEELWQDDPVWKYYKDPDKTTRATRNFTSETEALNKFYEDNSVGIIKFIPGKVKRCKYCPAVNVCTQADNFIKTGLLEL